MKSVWFVEKIPYRMLVKSPCFKKSLSWKRNEMKGKNIVQCFSAVPFHTTCLYKGCSCPRPWRRKAVELTFSVSSSMAKSATNRSNAGKPWSVKWEKRNNRERGGGNHLHKNPESHILNKRHCGTQQQTASGLQDTEKSYVLNKLERYLQVTAESQEY